MSIWKHARKITSLFLPIVLLAGCSVLPQVKFPFPNNDLESGVPYRGVFHIHTQYSHDSSGTISELIRSANFQKLDFLIITDHNTLEGKKEVRSQKTEVGKNDPLLMIGNEISTTDGHLVALGIDQEIHTPIEPQKAIDQIHSLGGYAILAHPVCNKTAWKDWNVKNFDGIEVYNFACDFYASNKISFFAKSFFLRRSAFLRSAIRYPKKPLQKFDQLMAERPVSAWGASDAHTHRIFGLPLMQYSLPLQAVTMYVNAKTLSEADVLNALVKGESFLVFESKGTAKKFRFEAETTGKSYPIGSIVQSETPVVLNIVAPSTAEIRLIRNGTLAKKTFARSMTFQVHEPGIYRAEVFRGGKIWIISNAITVGS